MKKRSNKKSRKNNLPISREMYDFDLLSKVLTTVDQRGCKDDIDRISELPHDILAYILSFLTLREATTTKILSTRWRGLYMPNTILLKYPFPSKLEKGDHLYGYYQIGDETQLSDHMKWLNHTLDSYTGGRVIKKFWVDIPYTTEVNNSASSKKLLEFALSRETEVIDINVVYPEPKQLFGFSACEIIKNGLGSSLPGLKCIKELSLSGVSMCTRDISILVSKLVALERLLLESLEVKTHHEDRSLEMYDRLDLVIDGSPTSKLKHLIISNVSSKYTSVSNLMNLVSLRCHGMVERSSIYLYNLTKLVDLRVHGETDHILAGKCPSIFSNECGELRRLELSTGLYKYKIMGDKRIITKICDHMKMITITNELQFVRDRLKHLQINVVVDEECNLHQLFSLIEGFPCLETLEIKFIWSFKPKYKHRRLEEDRVNRMTLNYLNMIKLSEFRGSVAELEFVLRLINNGVELQKLIVEGCATTCTIQQREIAHSFKHLIAVASSCVDLILK